MADSKALARGVSFLLEHFQPFFKYFLHFCLDRNELTFRNIIMIRLNFNLTAKKKQNSS